MSFYANRGLHHRALLRARQDTLTPVITKGRQTSTATPATRTPSTSSSRPSSTATLTPARSTSTSISSTTPSSRPVTSSSLVVTSQTSIRQIVTTPTTSSTSTSSSVSSVPTAQTAAKTTRKSGSPAGVIVGVLIAIFVILILIVFVSKRLRKRRNKVDDVPFFNKDKLERPGMVQGFAAGPGVGSLTSEKDSQSHQNDGSLPPSPYPFNTPQHQQISNIPPSPYGAGDPTLPSGSSYNLLGGQPEWGAPPTPGSNGPAPYSPYMATHSRYGGPNQTTPPGSPFGGGNSINNPFATPSGTDTHPSTPTTATWPHTPMGAYHLPLLPGGAFANDSYRDSSYSAAFSEAHVGQAYKVQVGVSMPKYEEFTMTPTMDASPGSPPPPFTTIDPAAAVATADPAYTNPATTVDKALPPRPVSTHTIYNPEDAYGGV